MSEPTPGNNADVGAMMHQWATSLFPLPRSLTGNGVRQTLAYLRGHLPDLEIHEVPTGTSAFDWTVPDEWNITGAYLEHESGERFVDFAKSNLGVVGYSEPVDRWLDLAELQNHLHSSPAQPSLTPYVTSYYQRRWGFCLPHAVRERLPSGRYHAVIDSVLAPGSLTYGELLLKGDSPEEVLLSTYVCHPSMANNELSGPVVATALAQWIAKLPRRRLTYRIVFVPETIGSIVYISRHLPDLRKRVVAGFVLTCVGDDRAVSFLPSRLGDTLADRVALHVLRHKAPAYKSYSFLQRGSDERQYCSPGVDLPVVSIMRSKYGEYPEYHTSADDLTLITPNGLAGSLGLYQECVRILEANRLPRVTVLCEPQLGKRGLYPTISTKSSGQSVRDMMNLIAYADGENDLVSVAELAGVYAGEAIDIFAPLVSAGLIEERESRATKGDR